MIHNNPYPHPATRSLDRSGSTVPAWLVCLVDEILQPIPECPRRTPLLLHAHHSQNSQCDSTRLISTKLGARLVLKLPPHSLHPSSLSAFSVPSFSNPYPGGDPSKTIIRKVGKLQIKPLLGGIGTHPRVTPHICLFSCSGDQIYWHVKQTLNLHFVKTPTSDHT
ncbi:uncharacterized protein H6S33_000829 [Morchella sextelata]|uniref:uncharacterized protein n=1 Tax=Morchella sextelata TaxID=1174677 RepID=UPI001D040E41|nr:uncharacterized protein H6S33_000829 [Morchella sextelata]KAH0615193.1 hypothetical protein H6S33_000829 [Morchella sextelata]